MRFSQRIALFEEFQDAAIRHARLANCLSGVVEISDDDAFSETLAACRVTLELLTEARQRYEQHR